MNSISRISRSLHWLIALGMIANWIVAHLGEDEDFYDRTHMTIGILVLFFGTWRLLNRLREGFPNPLSKPSLFDPIAKITHWILLLLPIIMPISGILLFYGEGYGLSFFRFEFFKGTGVENKPLADLAEDIHELAATVLLFALGLHVLGALKHHFIDKDETLKRMLGLL